MDDWHDLVMESRIRTTQDTVLKTESKILSCKPCGWYYRNAIRTAERIGSLPDLRNLALILLDELEVHRKAFRHLGYRPPSKYDPIKVTAPLLSLADRTFPRRDRVRNPFQSPGEV